MKRFVNFGIFQAAEFCALRSCQWLQTRNGEYTFATAGESAVNITELTPASRSMRILWSLMQALDFSAFCKPQPRAKLVFDVKCCPTDISSPSRCQDLLNEIVYSGSGKN